MARVDDSGLAPTISIILFGVNETVMEVGQEILAEAKSRVPLDTGELEASGRIEPSPSGSGIVISFYEMNGDHDVALDQHENMEYIHAPGRTDHYLSNPAYEIGQHIAKRVAAKLGGA